MKLLISQYCDIVVEIFTLFWYIYHIVAVISDFISIKFLLIKGIILLYNCKYVSSIIITIALRISANFK